MSDVLESVQCPECRHKFQVDITSSASNFTCPSCGAQSWLQILRNPNLKPNAPLVNHHILRAAADNISKHTALYRFVNPSGQAGNASAVVLAIDDRSFLLTVAHAVPASLESIQLVASKGIALPAKHQMPHGNEVVARHTSGYPDIDAAVLEISSDAIIKNGLKPITLNRVKDYADGNKNMIGMLCGYPDDLLMPVRNALVTNNVYRSMTYPCEVLQVERWQAITKRAIETNPNAHMFAYYCDTEELARLDNDPIGKMPRPLGLSGGGLWQADRPTSDNELWSAETMALVGIQSAWLENAKFLRLTQVAQFMKIIADNYADLSPVLHRQFPRLVTLH